VKRLIDEQRLDRDRTALVDDTKDYLDAAKQNGISFIFASYGYGKLDQNGGSDLRMQIMLAFSERVNSYDIRWRKNFREPSPPI
jgi:hypothetical protein